MLEMHLRFPGGKRKAVTLSYDDGCEQDVRLVNIMKAHGLRGTFNINSGLYANSGMPDPNGWSKGRLTRQQAQQLFLGSGMEVAAHSLTHPDLVKLDADACTYEVMSDRVNLEREYGCEIRGMAYPFGTYSDSVVDILKKCGIIYSRTVESTERFDLPADWLRQAPTCHHNHPRLMQLVDAFLLEDSKEPQLFYLWGHSREFDRDHNWSIIEEFADKIGRKDSIWYATNIQIAEYVLSVAKLIISEEKRKIVNPTNKTVWILMGDEQFQINPGETITY